MTEEETDRLRQLVLSLDNTLWTLDYRTGDKLVVVTGNSGDGVCIAKTPELAEYITFCSPRDILELLDELDQARAEIRSLKHEV